MSKTVLLTGAAGFIGSNFLRYLFDRYPDYQFHVLDALTYAGSQTNIPPEIQRSSRFTFWYGSITNQLLVDKLMSQSHFVVHFAAETHVARSIADDSRFFETDVLGTSVLMNALVRHKQVERFVHISSSEVYGTAEYTPMDEKHPLNPQSPYGGAKAGGDRLVSSYWSTYDVPVVILRPFNNYGPFQHLEKMIPRFITSALQGQKITIHGDGSAMRDWIFVEDHCRALDRVLHMPDFYKVRNEVINIGSGHAMANIDIAELILSHLGLPLTYMRFIGDRPGQVVYHEAAVHKAQSLLGWHATTSLRDGLIETIEWYEQNQDWWRSLEWMKQVPLCSTAGHIELH